MSYVIHGLKQFPVQFGDMTLYLSGYQLSGSSTLKETGVSDGSVALAGYWKQGIRIKLKGNIPPDLAPELVAYSLSQAMLEEQTLKLGKLSFMQSRLCGYTVSEQQDAQELQLVFYCPKKPYLNREENTA